MSVLLTHLFYCMFVCSSTIYRQPAGRFTPYFACGRSLGYYVSSPLLGAGGLRRAEKETNEIFVLWESMGNFCISAVFERYLSNACTDPHQILFVYGQCLPTCPLPPVGSIGSWGAGGGGVKNSKNWGVVSFMHRTATISIFLSDAKCGPVCRAQTCAHSGVEPSRSAKAFLQGGPKSSKKIRIFHHFETLRPYISETIKNRGI